MAVDYNGAIPVWRPGMTAEEKREYRRAKHRVHAARSRRLRGKQHKDRTPRGSREEYDCVGSTNALFPVPGDYNGDGVP